MTDANNIKELRKSLKMTQKDFAEFCGVTERTVQKWEGGSTIPPMVSKFFKYVEAERNSGSEVKNEGANSIVGNGLIGNKIYADSEIFSKALDEISAQRKLTETAQQQISQLTMAVLKLSSK